MTFRITRRFLVVVVMLLVVLATLPASANDLKLSDSQRAQLKDLAADLRRDTSNLRKKLYDERKELMQIYSVYNLDERKAKAQIDTINGIQYSLLEAVMNNQIRLRKIVSPQQFAELSRMQKEHVHKFSDNKGARKGFETRRISNMDRALEDADITPTQRQKLGKLYRDTAHSPRSSGSGFMESFKAVEKLYSSYNLNQDKVKSEIKRVNKAQRQFMLAHLERQKELRKILSAEQFAAVNKQFSEPAYHRE
jgi:Spy/CpxP family protein refolding chaperone